MKEKDLRANRLFKGLILFCNGAPIASGKWSHHWKAGSISKKMVRPLGLSLGWKWRVHLEDPIKKPPPLPPLQILPSPTFLLDATVESYNRDLSLLSSQKKSHFEIPCAL